MKSIEQVKQWWDCSDSLAERIMAVQSAGYRHGAAGWYPFGDFSSDADWCYGVGAEIQAIEAKCEDYDGSVFDLYMTAHAEGFATIVEGSEEDPFRP